MGIHPNRSPVMKLAAFLAFSVLFCLQSPSCADAARPAQEYHVKAVFLFNLIHFVEWPANIPTTDAFTIAIFGNDPFGEVLDKTIIGERKNNKPIRIKRFQSLDEIVKGYCDMLFISADALPRWDDLREKLKDQPTLTVADSKGFTQQGGMINLVRQGSKIKVEISRAAVDKPGFSVSSKLLSLANLLP